VTPTATVKRVARELGFDDCRIAAAREASHAGEFHRWIADGHHGDMEWLARNPQRRCDPREVLPGCQSVVCLALNYFTGNQRQGRFSEASGGEDAASASNPTSPPNNAASTGPLGRRSLPFRIARYAWNDDYHDIIEEKLTALDQTLRDLGGSQRKYVDYGPVLERDFATNSGLGWNGKSTVQIQRRLGTWFFLAEVLTTLDLEPDPPFGDHCGKCTRCIDACPTRAITAPHHLEARRCISYLTIEHKGPIPEEFRRAIGDRIYGCDDCLEVCPWNRFAETARESRFHAREEIFDHTLRDFLTLDEAAFRTLFARSPIKRLKLPRFLRNVCVALGNTGSAADLPALERASRHPDPLVTEHAAWAITEIRSRIRKNSG